jgi:hypothetical protein
MINSGYSAPDQQDIIPTVGIRGRLLLIAVGHTTTVNRRVVTRWTADTFEVNTYGLKTYDLDETAERCIYQ